MTLWFEYNFHLQIDNARHVVAGLILIRGTTVGEFILIAIARLEKKNAKMFEQISLNVITLLKTKRD